MAQELQVFNLALYAPSHVSTDKLLAGDDLERYPLSRAMVDSQLHLSKGALAQGADDLVGADALLRLGSVAERLLRRGGLGLAGVARPRLLGLRIAGRLAAGLRGWRYGELFFVKAPGGHGRWVENLSGTPRCAGVSLGTGAWTALGPGALL
jgi:hypothetical protein